MLKKGKSISLILLLLLVSPYGEVAARESNISFQAHSLMQEFFDASDSPGLVVSVGRGDKIIWSEGFGYADLEQLVPADPARTRFRIGSVIKSMTAYATAQLVDAGKLDLDAPVQTYVPEFPEKQEPITTRQLLGHLSGIRHYGKGEFFSREHYDTVSAGLVIFQDDPLVHKPEDSYLYSSYGYNLVSAVIEAVSGQSYLAYMMVNVFEPLEMNNTSPDYLAQIIPGRGRYYYKKENGVRNAPEVDNSYKWASGGFIGTSDDLVRFGLAQTGDNPLKGSTQKMYWTVQKTNSGEETGYGLGWKVKSDENGQTWIGHGGGSVGGTTQFWIRQDDGLVIAMISNMSSLDFGTILISLGGLFVSD